MAARAEERWPVELRRKLKRCSIAASSLGDHRAAEVECTDEPVTKIVFLFLFFVELGTYETDSNY